MRTRTPARCIALTWVLFAVPATSDPSAGSDADWSPGTKGEGRGYTYQVYSQQREGEPFVRYRVKGTIDAAPEVVQRLARDLSSDPARAPKDQTRVVILKTDTEQIIHTSIDLPMMFSDRDIVTRGVGSADAKTGIRRSDFKAIDHPSVPPRDGFIRLTQSGGFWEFVPDGDKRSKVTFEMFIDLGGSLPGWLVSGMMASNVIGNYEDVAKEAVGK